MVERIGPCTYREIWLAHGDIYLTGPKVYCERAVSYGLMEVDRRTRPATYRIVDGWRARFEKAPERKRVSSVFELGNV